MKIMKQNNQNKSFIVPKSKNALNITLINTQLKVCIHNENKY